MAYSNSKQDSRKCLVIVGEAANFVAYIYAPAVLVTPLGALSIIIRYVSAEAQHICLVTCDIL